MTEFRSPRPGEEGQLRALWREAFGESEEFIDLFFDAGYHPDRCRVAVEDSIAAMLYWFDCTLGGEKAAYLYGVATAKSHRGRGVATALLTDTEAHLKDQGYGCAILVPAGEALFRFYEERGYQTVGFLDEKPVSAGAPVPCRECTAQEYARLRRTLLPPNAVVQEGENLALLSGYARFFAGEGWCAVYTPGERPVIAELLGEPTAAAGLLGALEVQEALVRGPGGDKPFAMGKWFASAAPEEVYFAFAFD